MTRDDINNIDFMSASRIAVIINRHKTAVVPQSGNRALITGDSQLGHSVLAIRYSVLTEDARYILSFMLAIIYNSAARYNTVSG